MEYLKLKILKVLKKNDVYALLGYKTFIVKDNKIDDVYNFLNNKII